MNSKITIAALAAATFGIPAMGAVTITPGTSAPTYTGHSLNFDETGGPTGVVATDAWATSHGITELQAGDGAPQVDDWATLHGAPWVGTGMSFYGNFGVFMTFDHDISAMSVQAWDPSGPPGPFGGGMGVYIFNDGVEVANLFVEPAWGGIGDEWLDITTDGGTVFDEVRILGFGFSPTTYVDNITWDEAETVCEGDVTGDGMVNVDDLNAVIIAWGTNDAAADVDGSGLVDVNDLVTVITAWGGC